jgi:hypothetical protein
MEEGSDHMRRWDIDPCRFLNKRLFYYNLQTPFCHHQSIYTRIIGTKEVSPYAPSHFLKL